nr:MAG TPA: MXE GYRA INTEIN.2A [Bacteriophage sp.]
MYNFECETHTFMCRNILTHNCDPLTYQRGIIEQKR